MIEPASKGRCLERGVSTMRLSLGYRQGLPNNWSLPRFPNRNVICEIGAILDSFPNRRVVVVPMNVSETKEDLIQLLNGKLLSEDCLLLEDFEVMSVDEQESWMDKYLWAFSYRFSKGQDYHFVVGLPVGEADTIDITWAIAVSLEELNY